MALRAGAFPEKLGHSACSQPACAGKDWCITQPIGQRCTDDQPTIKGRTSANFGYSEPLFACVYRTFGDQFIAPVRTPVGQPVYQPRVAMERKNDRFVGGEKG